LTSIINLGQLGNEFGVGLNNFQSNGDRVVRTLFYKLLIYSEIFAHKCDQCDFKNILEKRPKFLCQYSVAKRQKEREAREVKDK
jgi:hypothetical protein